MSRDARADARQAEHLELALVPRAELVLRQEHDQQAAVVLARQVDDRLLRTHERGGGAQRGAQQPAQRGRGAEIARD